MFSIDVMTLMPQAWEAFDHGVIERAQKLGLWQMKCWQIRDFSDRSDRRVDSRPFGGGPGMVIQAPCLNRCWTAIQKRHTTKPLLIQMDPAGEPLTYQTLKQLSQSPAITILCGRYEGIDQRFTDSQVDHCISIGSFVVSGGDLPGMLMVDGLLRLMPEVLNNQDSHHQDSYTQGLLDHAQYTRPRVCDDGTVPEVLWSGHEKNIKRWQRNSALERTLKFNANALIGQKLSADDIDFLYQSFNKHTNNHRQSS